MLIRLIDVVLIILVGFVSVADIVPKSQIKLPQKDKEKEQQQEEIPIVYLGVLTEGYYIKVDEDSSYFADENFAALEMNLVNYYYNHPQSQILILPDDLSPIQNTINVIDLCQEYNIPKNLVFSDVTESQ